LAIGRQFGKSLLAANQALYWFFNVPNCKIGWVTPVYKQGKKVFKDIDLAFANNQHVFKDKNKTDLFFQAHNNSTLNFFSSERYDNIRGETFDYLICDEFAYQDEAAWTEVLRATVLVRGKKVLLISTTKGKNHFHTIFQLGGVNPQYKSFQMTSYDNPKINPTEIDDARATLPDHIFRQEYLAEFIDGGAGIFSPTFVDNKGGSRFYAGVDLGRADDYSVLSVLNEFGQQVYCERWRHDTWNNISRKIVDKINEFNAVTYVEVNSIGDAICEQIQGLANNSGDIHPFVTTSKSKNDIIEVMAVATQNNEVTFQPHDWLRKEFDVFTFEYNPKARSIKYGAPYGFHDDGIMASAISYCAFKNLKSSGEYFIS